MVKQTQTNQEAGMASELKARFEWWLEGWLFRRSNVGRVWAASKTSRS